jgi:CBS domain-containing protein
LARGLQLPDEEGLMSLERFTRKPAVSLPLQATLAEVAVVMRQRHVGAVVIIDQERPIGIVTDRDLALRAVAQALPADTQITAVMSPELTVARVESGLDEALFTMRKLGIRRLPIVDDGGKLLGMVTLDDILVLLSAELQCGAEAVLDNRGP